MDYSYLHLPQTETLPGTALPSPVHLWGVLEHNSGQEKAEGGRNYQLHGKPVVDQSNC